MVILNHLTDKSCSEKKENEKKGGGVCNARIREFFFTDTN